VSKSYDAYKCRRPENKWIDIIKNSMKTAGDVCIDFIRYRVGGG